MAFVVICCYLLLPAATCCLFHTRDRVPKTQLLSNFLSSISFFFFFFFFSLYLFNFVSEWWIINWRRPPSPATKWTIEKPRFSWPYIQYNWIYRLLSLVILNSIFRFFTLSFGTLLRLRQLFRFVLWQSQDIPFPDASPDSWEDSFRWAVLKISSFQNTHISF